MWFEHARYKEKIKFMFDDELSIEQVIFDAFIFYDSSRLKISLQSKNIPKVYPEKWKQDKFNTLILTLVFIDISSFECKGRKIFFECSPKITSTAESTTLLIESDDFYLRCVARSMDIDEIQRVFDSGF